MKHKIILFILLLGQIASNAQMDTLIVFDIPSETIEIIPIGPFDTIAISDYVPGYIGQWENVEQLDLNLPINLPPNASFSELVLAKNHFDLLKDEQVHRQIIDWFCGEAIEEVEFSKGTNG